MTITAEFRKGVFQPVSPVVLPTHTGTADGEPRRSKEYEAHLDRVYAILSRRFHSGFHDTAERHNEHQP